MTDILTLKNLYTAHHHCHVKKEELCLDGCDYSAEHACARTVSELGCSFYELGAIIAMVLPRAVGSSTTIDPDKNRNSRSGSEAPDAVGLTRLRKCLKTQPSPAKENAMGIRM